MKFKPEGYSETIFKDRYAFTEDESWDGDNGACMRVAKQIASAESSDKYDKYVKKFYEILVDNKFTPGGRIWYGSGRPSPKLLNCFVLGNNLDSKEGWGRIIYENVVTSMSGGGCGQDFSSVRPRNAEITGQRGVCPGAVELMKGVNGGAKMVRAGGGRRAANMFSLNLRHPDLMEFLDAKLIQGELDMANISVNSLETTKFIEAVKNDEDWELSWKGRYNKKVKAKTLWNKIVKNAYDRAEPGFLNMELALSESTVYYIEDLVTTNPCGEIYLTAYESCDLGHLVLPRFVVNGKVDWHLLAEVARLGVRFLDNVLSVNTYPLPEMKEKATRMRRIGLGTTGLADMLVMLGYKYGSEEGNAFIDKLYRHIAKASYEASVMLAVEKGQFPECKPELHIKSGYMKRMSKKIRALVEEHGIRNCAILTQAPTGCQKPDTLVSTEHGIFELQELGNVNGEKWQQLNIGVNQDNGKYEKTTQFYVNGFTETKKITLSSGLELEATPNHKYRTLHNGDYVWKRSDSLENGDKIVIPKGYYEKKRKYRFETIKKEHMNENEIKQPIQSSFKLGLFLGYFFADGSVHDKGIRIACNAKEVDYKYVISLGKSLFGINPTLYDNGKNCLSVCFNSKMLLRWLDKNNLMKDKSVNVEIPLHVRMFDRKSMIGFMLGYYRADGSTSVDNRYNSRTHYIDTASKKMSQQLLTIIRALGFDGTIQNRITGMGFDAYRVKLIKTRRRDETSNDTKALSALKLDHCTVDTVQLIEDSFNLTLDIEVPETATYIANGVVSHNTTSILSGNCSSGIEPIFAFAYWRNYWDGEQRARELCFHPLFVEFMKSGKDIDHFIVSHDLSVRDHMEVQKIIQKYVDNAVSKTINIPNKYPIKKMNELWLEYLPYLKGTTFYREGSRNFVDADGKEQEPPLVPISLKEAKKLYQEQEKANIEAAHVDDCVSGICEIPE